MATESTAGWQPDWAVPPGDILLELLEDRGMTQAELARRMDRPLKTINEIVKGKAAITPETAIQLERTLGTTARFWNSLESSYREFLARKAADLELESEASWLDRFPMKDLERNGMVRRRVTKAEALADLLGFFGLSSRSAWERTWLRQTASFRKSHAFRSDPEAVSVWLRWGELQAAHISSDPFDRRRLREVLQEVRPLTAQEPAASAVQEAQALCASCGVVLVMTPELKGAPVSGAVRWLSANRTLIQLSLRYKSSDQFWFSLFHEAGHLLSAASRQDCLDEFGANAVDAEAEIAADLFARDQLIPPGEYDAFVRSSEITIASIRAFAARLRVAPGIVVARLQHDQVILRSQFNSLKRPLHWITQP